MGLSLRVLCNEYRDLEGTDIPYKELGFYNLTAFLKSMPDMIRMFGNLQEIHSVTIFPVRNEENEHIIDMVSHQNKNRKKDRGRRGLFSSFNTSRRLPNPSPSYHPRQPPIQNWRTPQLSKSLNTYRDNRTNTYTPLLVVDHKNMMGGQSSQPFKNFSITKPSSQISNRPIVRQEMRSKSNPNLNNIKPIITPKKNEHQLTSVPSGPVVELPNQIKENIEKLMKMNDISDGLMIFNFDARYKHLYKESLNYQKFGYSSLADCLKTVPQFIQMIAVGTGSCFKLMPIKASVTQDNNQTSSTGAISTTIVLTNGHSKAIITTTASTTTVTVVTTSSNTITTTTMITPTKSTNTSNRGIPCTGISPKSSYFDDTRSVSSNSSSICSASDLNPNKRVVQNFRHILMLNDKTGIKATDFPKAYLNQFKVHFDSRIWGYGTAMEMFHSLTDIFAIETDEKSGDIVLHDSRFKKFDKPKPKPKTDPSHVFTIREIPDLIQAQVVRLIEMNMPAGLLLSQFIDNYNLNYDSIDLSHMKIYDTSHLFDVLETALPIQLQMIEGMKRVFIKSNKDVNEWAVQCCRSQRYIIPIVLADNLPPNVILPGQHFRPTVLPPEFETNEYVATYIASLVDPHNIYIQFRGASHHSALEKMMYDLEFYETADPQLWAVPYEFLCLNFPVVARFPGDRHWHRARISKLHTNIKRIVTVTFIDYGGIHMTDFKDLRLMKMEFLSLPVQALKVGLYGIKPLSGERDGWNVDARDKVLVFSKPYYSLACTLIEYRNGVPFVALCDTNTDSDIFIHEVLINDGHALYEDGVVDSANGIVINGH